jgi:hypothetical protein
VLEWLTFAAAALAAAGAIVGPFVAYRSAMNAVRRQEVQSTLDRRQTSIDLAISYAISEDPVVAEMGIKQLHHMLSVGELTSEQQIAAVSAIEARLQRAEQELGGDADALAVAEGPGSPVSEA